MKKKLMMVAAIIGVLSLGACVDDSESASTTAVRNAKAKQLEALAAYSNAQAEAALITANADKAMKEAEAAYKLAQAAAEQAVAEDQKRMTEEAKQEFAIRLETVKAQAELQILSLKQQTIAAEQALLDQADQRIKDLYGYYSTEADVLIGMNRSLLDQNAKISGLEANIISAEAFVKYQTAYLNQTIKTQTAVKTALEALAGNDRDALGAKIQELNVQIDDAREKVLPLEAPMDDARDAFSAAYNNLNMYYYEVSSLKLVNAAKELDRMMYGIIQSTEYGEYDYSGTVYTYSLVQSRVMSLRNQLTDNVNGQKDYLGKPKTATAAATGAYLDLENAEATLTEAKKPENNTPAWLIQQYEVAVQEAKEEIVRRQGYVADAEGRLAEFEGYVASFTGADKTAYDEALTELDKLYTAYETAQAAYDAANDKVTELNETLYPIQRVYNGLKDIATEIASCDDQIASAKARIANYTDVTDAQTAVAIAKQEIEVLTAKITAQKAIVDRAKAALDAAIKAGE